MRTHTVKTLLLTLFLIIACSIVIGAMSALFLKALSFVGAFRDAHPRIIFLIPLVGLLTAFVYQRLGKGALRGNNLIIESANENAAAPLRMAFLTFFFTVLTHLGGGSAGREGTAVQIGGSITSGVAQRFRLRDRQRKQLILSGISAGFGSVFGTPVAGAFFGLEMCYIGKLSYDALLPCMLSSFIANAVAQGLGAAHESYVIRAIPGMTPRLMGVVLLSACVFGVTARLFSMAIRALKGLYGRLVGRELLRALFSGGIVLCVIVVLNGARYGGLSTWLIAEGFGGRVKLCDPFMKFVLTCLTLGAGFQGGEATPLFGIGASLGGWIGQISGIEPSLLAALGLIAVFGCAANTPITTIMLGVELFGAQALPYYVMAAVISYYVSGHSGIYSSQIIATPKNLLAHEHAGLRLDRLPKRSTREIKLSK